MKKFIVFFTVVFTLSGNAQNDQKSSDTVGINPTNIPGVENRQAGNPENRKIISNRNVNIVPEITTSTDTLKNFEYTYGTGPSGVKSFTINGSNLTGDIVISVPSAFEISAFSGASFTGTNSMAIPHTNGNVNNLTFYVRLKSGLSISSYSGNMTFVSNGANTKTIFLQAKVNPAPVVLNVSTSQLNGFNYYYSEGPSGVQSFTVSASGLTGNVTVSAPANFEISNSIYNTYSNSVYFSATGGSLSSQTVYIRLKSGLSAQVYTGNLTVSTSGATNQTINLNGNVSFPKGISTSLSGIYDLNYEGDSGPSTIKSFVVYGVSLSSFLVVSAPANFEISTLSGNSFSGSGQILLQNSNDTINGTTIYVRLKKDLNIDNYSGNITLSSSGHDSKYIAISGSVTMPQNVINDYYYYESRNDGKLNLRNKWLFSRNLSNYMAPADLLGPTGTVRDMAVKDGKMLFIDRSNRQIIVVSGMTGKKLSPVKLADYLFTYKGKNLANTADSTWTAGTLGFNDIKVDNAGNVLIANQITSIEGRYQIWKVNMVDGTATLIIDQADLSTLFPMATNLSFDYFDVAGDVNSDAVIMAANTSTSSMEVYKWVITNGSAGNPTVIKLDNSIETGKDLAGLVFPGVGSQVFQVDNNKFFIDGGLTFPVLCDMNGKVIDGINSNQNNIIDSVTIRGFNLKMTKGNNGLKEFSIGNEHFIVMSASSASGITLPSAFRLFKYADANKSFATMDCLWTFPQNGMGNATNSYRTAMPAVEVNGNTAKIYVYAGENGYGVYEFTTDGMFSGENSIHDQNIPVISIQDNEIRFNKQVSKAEIYTVTGQKLCSYPNCSKITTNFKKGVYIMKYANEDGLQHSFKFVIK